MACCAINLCRNYKRRLKTPEITESCFEETISGAERTLLAHLDALEDALRAHDKKIKRECCEQTSEANQNYASPCTDYYTHIQYLETFVLQSDGEAWRGAWERLRAELWEEPLAGPAYRALHAHRRTLAPAELPGREPSAENVALCRAALRAVIDALRAAPARASRSVAELCPALGAPSPAAAAALAAILRLPRDRVLGLEDEIPVFADAVSTPGVLSVRLTRGERRRYLLKRERLALDAAAARAQAALTPAHPAPEVVLLSAECGLIEFLEGHERLRDLVHDEFDLAAGVRVERAARRNEELVLAPGAALRAYSQAALAVPPGALRAAFWRRCADPAHMARAARRYAGQLARAALANWLLGLGDRHAHNLLLAPAAGRLAAVDAGALFQRGARELPPARLTAQLRAPAPSARLEPELRRALAELRARRRRVLPVLRLLFAHAGDYEREVAIMDDMMSGRARADAVTAEALRRAGTPHAERYVDLIEELFAHEPAKPAYSVEEQVRGVLLLSSAPRVLAVTRAEWEPWL